MCIRDRSGISERPLRGQPAFQKRIRRIQMGGDTMFCHLVTRLVARRVAPALLLIVLAASEAFAQFDFVGSWAPIGSEDVQNDSVPVDYIGLALTEEGRARALSYNESQKSMFERQCFGWGAAYLVLGPFLSLIHISE